MSFNDHYQPLNLQNETVCNINQFKFILTLFRTPINYYRSPICVRELSWESIDRSVGRSSRWLTLGCWPAAVGTAATIRSEVERVIFAALQCANYSRRPRQKRKQTKSVSHNIVPPWTKRAALKCCSFIPLAAADDDDDGVYWPRRTSPVDMIFFVCNSPRSSV